MMKKSGISQHSSHNLQNNINPSFGSMRNSQMRGSNVFPPQIRPNSQLNQQLILLNSPHYIAGNDQNRQQSNLFQNNPKTIRPIVSSSM